ncbi:MAG: hypothetical protein RLZZ217_1085 [Planctomycetota bacterium]
MIATAATPMMTRLANRMRCQGVRVGVSSRDIVVQGRSAIGGSVQEFAGAWAGAVDGGWVIGAGGAGTVFTGLGMSSAVRR